MTMIDVEKRKARDFLLNKKARRVSREVVTFEHEGEAITAEVREPGVGQLSRILEDSGFSDTATHRVGLLGAYAAIELMFVPGTNEHLFKPEDLPTLLEIPCGSFLEVVAAKFMALIVEAQKVGKSSAPTAVVDSSSP